MLGYDEVHELLGQNLDEEETTDQRLTALAESVINIEAEEGSGEREDLPLTTGHARADAIRLGRRLPETRHLRAGGSGRIATFRLRAPTPGPDRR